MHGFGGHQWDFGPGKVVGQRAWKVSWDGQLESINVSHHWTDGENHCWCRHERKPGICNPLAGCGFWAYHDGSQYDAGHIDGVIEGWGKTTIGQFGFRVEKARIVALAIPGLRNGKLSGKQRTTWYKRLCMRVEGSTFFQITCPMTLIAGVFGLIFNLVMAVIDKWELVYLFSPVFFMVYSLSVLGMASLGIVYSDQLEVQQLYRPRLITDVQLKGIRSRYPSVKLYGSRKEMLAAHPVDPEIKKRRSSW